MKRIRGYLLFLMLAFSPAWAAADNLQIIGANQKLSDGARALELGDIEEGIQLTLAGLKTESSPRDRARALNNLCAGYTAGQFFNEAIRRCNQALVLNSRSWRTYNNRALANLGSGRVFAAKQDLRKGLALNPDSRKLAQVETLIEAREMRLLIAAGN